MGKINLNLIKRICNYLDIKTKIIDTSENLTKLKKGEGLKEYNKNYGLDNSIYLRNTHKYGYYNEENTSLSMIDRIKRFLFKKG